MKKVVANYVRSMGGRTFYSGHSKTMYMSIPNGIDIEAKVLERFGYNLPFRIALKNEEA